MVAIVLFLSISMIAVWAFVCNRRTYRKRIGLIDRWRVDNFDALKKEFDEVSYDRHMWSLIAFRDPRQLYGPLTQEIWQ